MCLGCHVSSGWVGPGRSVRRKEGKEEREREEGGTRNEDGREGRGMWEEG